MEENHLKPDDVEIDWGGIFRQLLRRAPVILLIAVSAALLAAFVTRTMLEPVYLSSTKMYVLAGGGGTLTTGDLQAGTLLTRDYEEIIRSRQVTETVIADLGLGSRDETGMMTHEELLKKITDHHRKRENQKRLQRTLMNQIFFVHKSLLSYPNNKQL